jgi:hypothetical protein
MAVWEDRRHLDELGRHRGPTKVEIQRFYHGSEIYDIPIDTRDPPLTDGEILMVWGKLHLVDEFAIIERVHNIMVDYNFEAHGMDYDPIADEDDDDDDDDSELEDEE